MAVNGKVSWFGGPNDGSDSGKTALGLTTATPGVAIRPGGTFESGRRTLGGYWRVTDKRTGKSVVLKQTDLGPHEKTGRRIDLTYSALKKFGYNESDFPTDSTWSATYLGKKVPKTDGVRASKVSRAGVSTVNEDARAAALQGYLAQRGRPGALLALAGGLQAAVQPAQGVPGASQTNPQQTNGEPRASSSFAQTAKQRADIIDSKKLPYLWGGGHGGKVDPRKASPLDCSGAVSSVLGINPRVSGEFRHWGSPGRAPGGKGVTVYSNAEHVLMEIDGHFWGTSKSNPGGGAGWIPRSKISPEYLRGFVARHTKR